MRKRQVTEGKPDGIERTDAPAARGLDDGADIGVEAGPPYHGQRASAGLIVTEGTSPSPNGLGYARIPGLYNTAHAAACENGITKAVHDKGGKIFIQLMHTGRVAHIGNLPAGAEVVGPSSAACPGEMYTDATGMQPHSVPRAMTEADIARAVEEYAHSARLALEAGFDGVELHGANGYLIEQFLNPNVNQRTDAYGATVEGRNRLAIEIARATVAAIGPGRAGIRLSPYGVFNGTGTFPEVEEQFLALASELSKLGLLYLHLVDHSAMGAPPVPAGFKTRLRAGFNGLFILSGGFNGASAETALLEKRGDLVAFGRPFLANPDLVARLRAAAPLNEPDMATFYTPGLWGTRTIRRSLSDAGAKCRRLTRRAHAAAITGTAMGVFLPYNRLF